MTRGAAPRRPFRDVLRDARDFREVRASQYGLVPVLVLAGIGFFQRFDSAAFVLAGPEIARDLDIDVGDIVGIQILVGTAAVVAALFAGYYADRHRRVPFVSVGTFLSGLFSAVTGRGRSFAGVATPRVVDDAADVASEVPRFSLLADYYPPEVRGKAFALLGTLARSAGLVSPVVVGYAVLHLGWRTSLVTFAVPLMVMGALAHLLLREPVRGYFERRELGADDEMARIEDEPQSFGEAWRSTWAVRTVRRVTIANVFLVAADTIFLLFYPFFLAERYGLDPLERGFVAVPGVVAAVVGGLVGGALIDTFTRRSPARVVTMLGVFSLLLAPGALVYVLEPPLVFLVLASVVIGFGTALVGPALTVVFAQVIPPTIRTQGLQMTALAVLPTTILFLPIARKLFTDSSYEAVFLFTIPLAALGAALLLTASGFFELDLRNAAAAAAASEPWRAARDTGDDRLLVVRGLEVGYGGVPVLFGVDLDVADGEIVALLGTNGAGKSTLLRAVAGAHEASAGAIVLAGRDITHMPPHEIAARGVILVPGGRGVFPNLTVRENLLLGLWLVDGDAATEGVDEILSLFPTLRSQADLPASLLSGGGQQQLALAQAFLCRPRLLLVDELSLGLSPRLVTELVEAVKEVNRRGVTVVVVEQSVDVALELAARAVFLEKGEVRFDGAVNELFTRRETLRADHLSGGIAPPSRPAPSPPGARTVLRVDHVLKQFGGVVAVDDVSFGITEGEIVGLIGANGAGKTSLFDLLGGQERVDAGTIELDGVDVTASTPDERARSGLVRRFQDARLFPSLSVLETVLVAMERHADVRRPARDLLQLPSARRAERRARTDAAALVDLVGLARHRDTPVGELSTGLRRIVDLACVLAARPRLLLLDEPSGGVTRAEAERLGPLLRRVRAETGCTMLVIEHDMALVAAVADRLLALDQGRVVTDGAPDAVLRDERVIAAYLGRHRAIAVPGSAR